MDMWDVIYTLFEQAKFFVCVRELASWIKNMAGLDAVVLLEKCVAK